MPKNEENPLLTIGQLARRLGLNVRTLRYYETIGLLAPARRSASGYRLYSAADERLLRFVLAAKRVGFTLEEIRQIVSRSQHGSSCSYVRETLQRHISALDARIAEMQHLRTELGKVAQAWQRNSSTGAFCGLIEQWPGSFASESSREVTENDE